MAHIRRNLEEGIFIRNTTRKFIADNKSCKTYSRSNMFPNILSTALGVYGIEFHIDYNNKTLRKSCSQGQLCWWRLKIVMPYAAVLLCIIKYTVFPRHLTFLFAVLFDYFCYIVGLHIFISRKKKIVNCMEHLTQIPSAPQHSRTNKSHEVTSVLLLTACIYTIIYLVYGLVVFSYECIKTINDESSTTEERLNSILEILTFLLYCFVVLPGISIHLALFVYFASEIYKKLLLVDQNLKQLLTEGNLTAELIRYERAIYCKLQKISSSSDVIFNELLFLLLMKVVFRVCLCAIDILTQPWTGAESLTLIIVLLDIIFDFSLLFILCTYGGRIDDGKTKVLDSLVYMGTKYSSRNEDVEKEILFFINLAGHSNINFTAGGIFVLNKSIGITIMGALASYCVLIYQLAP